MDRAGAAKRHAATVFGTGQTDGVAQYPKQGRFRVCIDFDGSAIDVQLDHGLRLRRRRSPLLEFTSFSTVFRYCRWGEQVSESIQTEVVIVGAGPCGLFQVFELGLLGMRAHVLDSLQAPGGQCTELYPDKPIYDIPALPVCGAQELVDRLMHQIKPFEPVFHLGEEVLEVRPRERRFDVVTSAGTRFDTGAIVIAAGVGSFQPRRLGVPGCDAFEGETLHYRVKGADDYRNKHLVIFGGGDSALDWVIEFAATAPAVTLVHRRSDFRAAPASVARMRELEAQGKLRFIEGLAEAMLTAGANMTGVRVKAADGVLHDLRADHVFAFFGLHPKLGPVAEWGLDLERKAL
ncbi:MAG: NAD(P)/FAD-dependent oxidoreductase, partial [Gammaproteobacteria bacterium]|nr:NAD(P)/FAD-dependent oxidoreductase [Gammaproteobacteria bacterium]